MTLKFVKKQHEAENVWSLYFKPEIPIRYSAGQFVEITIDHNNIDDRGNIRWFTLSSSPNDELIRITTRRPESKKPSSYKRKLFNLKVGDPVESSSPMGDFILPKNPEIPLVFIAVGIGITPFVSIISSLKDDQQTRDIQLLYQIKDINEVPFQSLLDRNNSLRTIITDTKLSVDYILGKINMTSSSQIFLAGPEETVEKLTKELIASPEIQIQPEQIVTDYFPGYL